MRKLPDAMIIPTRGQTRIIAYARDHTGRYPAKDDLDSAKVAP